MEDAALEHVELAAAIHAPAHEPMDLPLGLPVAVLQHEPSSHGRIVPFEAERKPAQFLDPTLACSLDPGIQARVLPRPEHAREVLGQGIGCRHGLVAPAEVLYVGHLFPCQAARPTQEEQGNVTRRWALDARHRPARRIGRAAVRASLFSDN